MTNPELNFLITIILTITIGLAIGLFGYFSERR